MKNLRISSLALLLVLSIGCISSEKRQDQLCQLNYPQAVDILKHYVLVQGFYEKEEDIRFSYEPNNFWWNALYSNAPKEVLEKDGLADRNFYAFFLGSKKVGARGPDVIVFVDKDEKRVIGVLSGYESHFEENRKSDYDQAIETLKEHVLALGLYDQEEDVQFMYEPNNGYWNMKLSSSPEMLEKCGLIDRKYYAFLLIRVIEEQFSMGPTVFIDKDEKRVIGVLYDDERFVENTAE